MEYFLKSTILGLAFMNPIAVAAIYVGHPKVYVIALLTFLVTNSMFSLYRVLV